MMNIRGKSSPIQSSIRTVPNQTRGQTPPPASQLRGHFEDTSQFQHFQAAGHPYQQPSAYLEMNKPAPGRGPGPAGLPQAHQSFNMQRAGQHGFQGFQPPRGQYRNQNFGLVGDNSQEPPAHQMWNQGSYYLPAPNQNMRQPRMPMNNSQVAYLPSMGGNMANMAIFPGNMAPAGYSGNQAMQFMQNPNSQYMSYPQQRMPFPAAMPQQQPQMGFMPQYAPTSSAYAAPAYFQQPPMGITTNSRPASAGPQGAMGGGGPKPPRSRKMLSLRDPNTGEDLTEKVFKPAAGEETDPNVLESQAHREAVHLEFATKVAFLAKDKHQHSTEGSHAIQITAPPPQSGPPEPQQHPVPPVVEEDLSRPPRPSHPPPPPSAVEALHSMHEPPPPPAHTVPAESLVMNGEAESSSIPAPNLSMQPPPAPFVPAAKQEFEPPAETMADAAADVQTPSPALPSAAPVVPEVAAAPAETHSAPVEEVSPPPPRREPTPPPVVETPAPVVVVEEKTPPPPEPEVPAPAVPEKEPTPPVESAATEVPSTTVAPPLQVTSVIAAEVPKVIAETASAPAPVPMEAIKAAQIAREAQAQQSQEGQQASSQTQAASQPQPQRDGKKSSRKYRKELNKKNKDGNDMDAYVDTEGPKQESAAELSAKATPPPSSTSPPPSTSPPATEAPAAAAGAAAPPPEAMPEPSTAPKAEAEEVKSAAVPEPEPEEISAAAPEPSPAEPQPAAEASKEPTPEASPPSPTPTPAPAPTPAPQAEEEETSEEAAKPEGAEAEDDATQKENGEVTEAEMYDRLMNSLGIKYKEDQWSPMNPEGKKQYDREFLLKLQANPESRKAPALPHMPEITVDPKLVRGDEIRQRAQLAANSSIPDFTPGFFKSFPTRPTPSLTKRGSQQRGGRGGPPSQSGEQRIILSTRQEVQLHKSENAYKPLFQTGTKLPEDEQETKKILRAFQGILNKLTPEKFQKLVGQTLELKIDTEERLMGISNLIFEKAIAEQKFANVYAELCNQLQKLPKLYKPVETELKEEDKGKEPEKKMKEVTFRGVLLTKCQREFEKDKETEKTLESLQQRVDEEDKTNRTEQQKKVLKEELEQATKMARHRTLGNIKFIGELFRLKMLTETIMHDCIFKLLKLRDDDSIECLTKLLEVVGKDLDHQKARQRMDQYFAQLEKMVADMRPLAGGAAAPAREGKEKLSSRVKFFVLDILDMRLNGWGKRRIHDQNQPTTLGAIHQKAKQEEQAQQFLNSQPRQEPSSARGGARPKGRGSQQGDADGWNTVPPRQVKQNIEPTRMKITKTNVDVNNVTLGGGNKFRNWIQGSQGGGSRSQEQEKMGNRYNALNTLTDNDGRRSYGRSPARDSRGGSGRMDRDLDRRDRDRDRDFRKPVARSSMEERERAVATSRNMLGAVGGSSNPSSRNGSRDNSRSRDTPPAKVSGVDAGKMSPDELERRINTIAEEFVSNNSFKDTQESIAELRNLNYSMLVTTMMEKLIEKAGNARKMLGQLLFHLVREKQLSVDDLVKGLKEFLQYAEDLELDVPKIWDYLAEVMASLVVDHKVLPLSFLQLCLKPIVAQGKKKEVGLVSRTLKLAAEYKSKEATQAQWAASGLKLSEFGLSDSEFKWLKGPARNMVHQEVLHRLKKNEKNEKVFEWIDENVTKEDQMSSQFVREFFSAICRHIIVGNGNEKQKVNTEEMKYRVPLVRRYVENREKGTQALFGIQHLMCELEHPQDLARILFEMCYDEDMISEDSFYDWESREGPPEDNVGKGVVKLSTRDFFNWLRSGPEEERTS